MRILIVEDNEVLSGNIKKFFALEDIYCFQIFNSKDVLFHLADHAYDCIILDLGLVDGDGVDICKKIRAKGKNTPILMLTARATTKEKVIGLESGADDYMTKPFEYDELLARINALIRRNFTIKSTDIKIGSIEIKEKEKRVTKNDKQINLSHIEFDLLVYLVKNKGKILTKEELLEKVWGEYDDFNPSRTVDVYVGYLRKKFGKKFIETKRGIGYIIL